MEKNERARTYAEETSASVIRDAIERAYAEGYQDGYDLGYQDGHENRPEK